MNCKEFEYSYHRGIDEELSPEQEQALRDHQNICSNCAQKYQSTVEIVRMLQDLDVPPASENFAAQAIARAIPSEQRAGSVTRWQTPTVLVASLLLAIVATIVLNFNPNVRDSVIVFSGMDSQMVQISIDSEKDFASATIAIELTDNLKIEGALDSRFLEWETELKKGSNVIHLPILPVALGDGSIITRVKLGENEKSVRIRTQSNLVNEVNHHSNTNLLTKSEQKTERNLHSVVSKLIFLEPYLS